MQEYGIADQIGHYILNNAANNNTAVESLEAARRSEANGTRLRCLGHIINLVVKAEFDSAAIAVACFYEGWIHQFVGLEMGLNNVLDGEEAGFGDWGIDMLADDR